MGSKEATTLFPESPRFSWRETAVHALLTGVIWGLSVTIFLPLFITLKLWPLLRNKCFAFILSTIMTKKEGSGDLTHYRRKLFELIKEHTSKNGDKSIKFLEIGVGPGGNFGFYPENHSLTTVDMNPHFDKYLRPTLKKYPNIKLEKTIIGFVENMSEVEDDQFDVVVATLLLCSVTDVDTALNEIHRVLKKGGKFAFFDHVIHPQHYFLAYLIQQIMTPMWKVYMDGCHLNRDIMLNVNLSRFSEVSCKMYYPGFLDLFFRPHLMGICTK